MSKNIKKKTIGRLKLRKKKVKKLLKPAVPTEDGPAPRITSDTVAEHREEILSGARRFIYPLQHTRKKVVFISSLIILLVFIGSVLFSGLMLYRYKSTSKFAYKVSQIIPFPVAKVDGSYIPYEDYLFELNYSLFYYQNYDQEGIDINSSEGKLLSNQLKTRALEKVKLDKIAKQLAVENNIKITSEDIDKQISVIRKQGGIGDSDQVLEEILKSSYNWDIQDLRHTIELQLIRQRLPKVLDTKTVDRANLVLKKLNNGEKFADLAKQFSDDDQTKGAKGVIGLISRTDSRFPPEFIDAVFALGDSETSGLIESGFGLHIIKINKVKGDQREVAHILFRYFNINQFLRDELAKSDVVDYISL